MSKKNETKATTDETTGPNLAELLADGGDGSIFDYDSIEWNSVGRLITVAARLGCMVSIYHSASDNALCVSIRAGDQRRAYSAPDADSFTGLCNGLAAKLGGGFRQVK